MTASVWPNMRRRRTSTKPSAAVHAAPSLASSCARIDAMAGSRDRPRPVPAAVGAGRRLQHPKADNPPSIESDPEAEARDLFAGVYSALASSLDLASGKRATVEVAEEPHDRSRALFPSFRDYRRSNGNQLSRARRIGRFMPRVLHRPAPQFACIRQRRPLLLPPETAAITQAELSLAAPPVRSELPLRSPEHPKQKSGHVAPAEPSTGRSSLLSRPCPPHTRSAQGPWLTFRS